MYAIVDIAGQQFKVEEGQKIFVHRLDAEEGENVEFDKVLLIEDGEKIIVGEPVIKDALISGKILDHVRGDKVIVFKKKRKKGYRIKNGHRQNFTQIEIVTINEKGGPRKPVVKKEKVVVAKADEAETVVAEKKPAAKKVVAKKAEAEKPEVKKAAVKKEAVAKPAAAKVATKKPAKGKTE